MFRDYKDEEQTPEWQVLTKELKRRQVEGDTIEDAMAARAAKAGGGGAPVVVTNTTTTNVSGGGGASAIPVPLAPNPIRHADPTRALIAN